MGALTVFHGGEPLAPERLVNVHREWTGHRNGAPSVTCLTTARGV